MKYVIFTLFATCSLSAQTDWTVEKASYFFTSHLDLTGDEGAVGRVEVGSPALAPRYEYRNNEGELIAAGCCSRLSLGAIFTSATHMTVVAANGRPLGTIVGNFFTGSAAQFVLSDGAGRPLGKADVDYSYQRCSITDPANSSRRLAKLTCQSAPGGQSLWTVELYEEGVLPDEVIHIFSAFIANNYYPKPKTPIIIIPPGPGGNRDRKW